MSAAEQFHVREISLLAGDIRQRPGQAPGSGHHRPAGLVIGRIENDRDLTVVVFRGDTPGYFMAHRDFLADNDRVAGMPPGATDLHPYLDNFVRLTRLPVATVSEIRGHTRGAGSEFVLATDIRFASDKAVLGQFEVGVDAVPGGGPMARLACRLTTFDKVAVAGIKVLVDAATLPEDDEFAPSLEAYFATAGRTENLPFAQLLLENGLQQPDGIETDLGTAIGKLRQKPGGLR